MRRDDQQPLPVSIANADPLSLAGIIMPGPRVSRLMVAAAYPAIWKQQGGAESAGAPTS